MIAAAPDIDGCESAADATEVSFPTLELERDLNIVFSDAVRLKKCCRSNCAMGDGGGCCSSGTIGRSTDCTDGVWLTESDVGSFRSSSASALCKNDGLKFIGSGFGKSRLCMGSYVDGICIVFDLVTKPGLGIPLLVECLSKFLGTCTLCVRLPNFGRGMSLPSGDISCDKGNCQLFVLR